MASAVDAIGYRSDAIPDRTPSEQLRRSFKLTGAAWATVCSVVFLLLLFFGLGVLQLRGEPADGGHLLGTAIAALIFCSPLIIYGGYRTLVLEPAFTPHVEIEEKWKRILSRCQIPVTRVRYLSGNAGLNEVAIMLTDGVPPEKLGRAALGLASAWGVPGVSIARHPGGWFSAQLLGALPPAPPEPEPEPEAYRLPVARTWKQYMECLPVGTLHRHTGPGYISADAFTLAYPGLLGDPAKRLPRPWGLPLLGSHVLFAGRTGAGKSSWIQAVITALQAPVVHGAAVLVGIDPKGVELALGRGFFRHYASDYDAIADLLELMVTRMNERKLTMQGKSRLVKPNSTTPLYVIIIDELAAIGKLDVDAKRRARTIAALNLLLTQGRALGFSVVGAVQDPTKDTIPNRDLFNLRVALALTAPMTDLVLGPKCREEGANAHLITKEWAGAGYLHDGEGWAFARADWVSDDEILSQAADFIDGEYQGDKRRVFLPIDEGTTPPEPGPGGGARRPRPRPPVYTPHGGGAPEPEPAPEPLWHEGEPLTAQGDGSDRAAGPAGPTSADHIRRDQAAAFDFVDHDETRPLVVDGEVLYSRQEGQPARYDQAA